GPAVSSVAGRGAAALDWACAIVLGIVRTVGSPAAPAALHRPSQPPLMLAGQRQMLIVEEVRRRGAMRVSELTELLDVSEMTVRRDLDALAGSGVIEKVH